MWNLDKHATALTTSNPYFFAVFWAFAESRWVPRLVPIFGAVTLTPPVSILRTVIYFFVFPQQDFAKK